jgi:hypothetical protein
MSAATAGPTVTFQPLGPEHLKAVKTLNNVLFPIKYHVSACVHPNSVVPAMYHHQNIRHTKPRCLFVQDRVYEDAVACGPVSQLGERYRDPIDHINYCIGQTREQDGS